MAKKRRGYEITNDTYNVGGGGGGGSSNMVFYKGTTSTGASKANFIQDKHEFTGMADINTTGPTLGFSWDHTFDNAKPAITAVLVGTVPAGLTNTISADSGSGDSIGYVQISGAPSASAGEYKWSYTITDPHDDSVFNVKYKYTIAPTGTTPVWSSTTLPNLIMRNTSAYQFITVAATTSYAGATYKLENLVNGLTGVTLAVDTYGRVWTAGTPNTVLAATTISFDIVTDLGDYGTVTQSFSGSVSLGDPYGARYFGPSNAKNNFASTYDCSTEANTETYFNPLKRTGALRKYQADMDTSPYSPNDGYGSLWTNNTQTYATAAYYNNLSQAYSGNGVLGVYANNGVVFASSTNHQLVLGKWTVPTGVTSFCAVAVGGGSGGSYTWANAGGGGGGLAWMNGITTTPGKVYTLAWGLGRTSMSTVSSYGGGNSFLIDDATGYCIIFAQGGGYTGYSSSDPNGHNASAHFGGYSINGLTHFDKGNGYGYNTSQDGGGWGVRSQAGNSVNGFHYGGGAAIYSSSQREGSGAGGYRGNQNSSGSNQPGVFGGGGSGYYYSSTWGQGAGGGTGLDGQGKGGHQGQTIVPRTNTQAGSGHGGYQGSYTSYSQGSAAYFGGGAGGSGGSRGTYGENPHSGREENNAGWYSRQGGAHGGGGGGSGTSGGGGHGGPGGIRLIWGDGADGTPRSFPFTYCSEKPTMKFNGE